MRTIEEQVSYPQCFITYDESMSIHGMRGITRYHAGLYAEARPLMEQAVAFTNRPEDWMGQLFNLWILDLIHLATGHYAAVRLGPDMSAEDRAGLAQTPFKYSVCLNWGILDLLRQDWTQAEQNFQSRLNHTEKTTETLMKGISMPLQD